MRISPAECKLLIYKKMKAKGLSYSEAKAEVDKEQKHLEKLTKDIRHGKKMAKKPDFKEEFTKLRNGERQETTQEE